MVFSAFVGICPELFRGSFSSSRRRSAARPRRRGIYENGGASGTNITLIVTRSPGSGVSAVQFGTFNLTATAGQDYIATNGVLSFVDGETFKVINIGIIDDLLTEPSELNVRLSVLAECGYDLTPLVRG